MANGLQTVTLDLEDCLSLATDKDIETSAFQAAILFVYRLPLLVRPQLMASSYSYEFHRSVGTLQIPPSRIIIDFGSTLRFITEAADDAQAYPHTKAWLDAELLFLPWNTREDDDLDQAAECARAALEHREPEQIVRG